MIKPTPFDAALYRLQCIKQTGFGATVSKTEAAALIELIEAHIGLIRAAQEMIEVLAVEPTGPLWPDREELARGFIGWHQRLERAKDACPIKAIRKDAI